MSVGELVLIELLNVLIQALKKQYFFSRYENMQHLPIGSCSALTMCVHSVGRGEDLLVLAMCCAVHIRFMRVRFAGE